ncbi:MAG: phosphoribosylanthranilate isomerase [Novosphingobium sp.]|uniref:phosphoribosylanthranilate isomerase n=1 Tax=Novosphingobium sp. TaxID=1874826 RepID=UPI0032BE60E0
MPAPKIKLCGLNDTAALAAALDARADFVGFNFYPPSPRFLSLDLAAGLGAQAAGRSQRIGVFVDADDAAISAAIDAARLDGIQLHGHEPPARAAELRSSFGLPVWKVLSVASAADIDRADGYAGAADFILFDAKTPKGTLPGGMGLVFDWALLGRYRGALPWGLAGGLTPTNVAGAVIQTGAPLVDAASGIESAPGIKDPALIAAFCAAARAA